ncbi:MAG: AAA family ATPase [Erysipelotrichaceae bacterium]|nr:AAA family ATPase [Erysipelotrichaceae bacterium]
MNDQQASMDWMNQVYNVVFELLKRWQLILFVTVLCATSFDLYQSIIYTPIYRCEATFAVTTNLSSSDENDVGETFSYIFSSNIFRKTIQEAMHVDSLNGYFEASVRSESILYVYAYSSEPKTAYDMLNALMDNYTDISRLVVGDANIDLLSNVSVPATPYNELDHMDNLFKAGSVGFILIVALISCMSFFRNTIKDKYDIERKLNLRLLGSLPKESKITNIIGLKRKKSILITQYSTSFQYIESFKRIRSRIERSCHKHDYKVIMITSSLENEGKSSIAVNTAISLAMNKHKVLLIDADLRKPSLHLILDYHNYPCTINDVLDNTINYQKAIYHLDNYHIDVMLGIENTKDIDGTMHFEHMNRIMNQLKQDYDYILIDTAPSRFISDTNELSAFVDAIILVVKQNHCHVNTILDTIDKLSLSSAPIMGCIHNQSYIPRISNNKYYGNRYGYYRYYNRRRDRNE